MNRFGSFIKPLMWFAALLLAAFVAGCGGGDDDAPGLQTPIGDVTGAWTIAEADITSTEPACASPPAGTNPVESYSLTFTQTGNTLAVSDGTNSFTGTISGSTVSWTGSFPDNGGAGTTTINSLSATVDPGCNTLSAGTMNWTYVEPAPSTFTCTATTTFTGTEPAASGC